MTSALGHRPHARHCPHTQPAAHMSPRSPEALQPPFPAPPAPSHPIAPLAGKPQPSLSGEARRGGRVMPGPRPRCEEAAPPPPNLLLARPRHWISWREGARHRADARHGRALHPALTKHQQQEQLGNRHGWTACGGTAGQTCSGQGGDWTCRKTCHRLLPPSCSPGTRGRSPFARCRHLCGAWVPQDHRSAVGMLAPP